MEKKIKYRILGLLIIAALIILFLPMFQTQSAQPSITLVEPPPFPHPTNELSAKSTIESDTIPLTDQPPTPQSSSVLAVENRPVTPITDTIMPTNHPGDLPETVKQTQEENESVSENKHPIITGSSLMEKQALSITNNKSIVSHHSSFSATVSNHDNLIGPYNFAWAIQIGSFKNKKNAVRLVNHLRENGYRAFLRHFSTSFGDKTRVYVGPELKRALANKLATKLENDLHIKGIIIRYQPLSF